jgi:hypothetical protein
LPAILIVGRSNYRSKSEWAAILRVSPMAITVHWSTRPRRYKAGLGFPLQEAAAATGVTNSYLGGDRLCPAGGESAGMRPASLPDFFLVAGVYLVTIVCPLWRFAGSHRQALALPAGAVPHSAFAEPLRHLPPFGRGGRVDL